MIKTIPSVFGFLAKEQQSCSQGESILSSKRRQPKTGGGFCSKMAHMEHPTRQLLRQLTQEGHDIWLYTTSLRSPFMLGMWFWCLGIRLGGVINQTRHTQVLRQFSGPERHVNKYPPAFEIDWRIDDSIGVKEDGARYGFSVIHIQPDDLHWVSTLRQTLISANVLA